VLAFKKLVRLFLLLIRLPGHFWLSLPSADSAAAAAALCHSSRGINSVLERLISDNWRASKQRGTILLKFVVRGFKKT
jgi:hypothetical protein